MKQILYLLVVLVFFGCGEDQVQKQKITVSGYAQGTTYNIVYISNDGKNYQRAIDSTLIEIDNSMSTYNKNSLISKFNGEVSEVEVDELFKEVLAISKKVYEVTDKNFDPTIAPIVNFWGFGFENKNDRDTSLIDSLIQLVDLESISIKGNLIRKQNQKVMLDFNAVAQGYTVDVLGDLLERRGISNYLVEVGGELKAKGVNMEDTLWRIGIDKPLPDMQKREIEAIVHMENRSLATSGNYRKFYEKGGKKYSHTIDPKTGYPVQHNLLSATVVANECAYADAYATAFMVMGIDESKLFLQERNELDALLIYSDEEGNLQHFITKNLESKIELNSDKR